MNNRIFAWSVLAVMLFLSPAFADDSQAAMNTAGSLYSQSVDLANEGKYQQALDAADKALAMNVPSLTALIQSNRAGILVMLDRNEEAVAAADAALGVEGNLTTVHSIAYYNKGNALKNLGRLGEAKDAYDHAYALDNTLVPPNLGPVTAATTAPLTTVPPTAAQSPAATVSVPLTAAPQTTVPTKSPLFTVTVVMAAGLAGLLFVLLRR